MPGQEVNWRVQPEARFQGCRAGFHIHELRKPSVVPWQLCRPELDRYSATLFGDPEASSLRCLFSISSFGPPDQNPSVTPRN